MKYEAIRDQLKSGDMLLFRNHSGGGLRGTIERWFVLHGTASPYAHVGVCWSDHGRVWVMDMTTKGCAPRLLSTAGDFDWAPAPRELTDSELTFAASHFGELDYSRWRALGGQLGLIDVRSEHESMCAEYALAIWNYASMPPTDKATPASCADGAMLIWNAPIYAVENGGRK